MTSSVRAASAAAAIVAVTVVAGCSTSRGPSAGPAAHTTASNAMTLYRQLAQCIRSHGLPTFPDPVAGTDGQPTLPDNAPRVPVSTRHACAAIGNRLPTLSSSAPVSQVTFNALLAYARCMRTHGLHDWPDPGPDGVFTVDRRIVAGGKRLFLNPDHACDHLNPDPDKRIQVREGS